MRKAIIIGAGPAGLTAAYQFLTTTDIKPVIIEADNQVGGLAKTIEYKGNRIDLGGHRFFSKSDIIINWWLHFLPLENPLRSQVTEITYHHNRTQLDTSKSIQGSGDQVMLVRPRKSRIYFRKKFFDYPLKINRKTIANLGIVKLIRVMFSYIYSKTFPRNPESSLESFFINQFGNELYQEFFKEYTEKVWGVPCDQIPASWGYQRVKELNLTKAVFDSIRTIFHKDLSLNQKNRMTSLIEQFLYPKFGPGQLWETVASEIKSMGGEILLNASVEKLSCESKLSIESISIRNLKSGELKIMQGDYFLSSMPIRSLVENLSGCDVPKNVMDVTNGLQYRDFLIVGLLVSNLENEKAEKAGIQDNWIYLQDKDIKAGRLQLFHNWSPSMIANQANRWLGIEYFCNEDDNFWNLSDEKIIEQGIFEMSKIGLIKSSNVIDATVVRVKKAYPSYYGSYSELHIFQDYINKFGNLYLMGRNGLHRYNNTDHSMLTAMTVVDNIRLGKTDKTSVWDINTEMEYHESKV